MSPPLNVTTIQLVIDLRGVHELAAGDKPWAIAANQHDSIEVYVVRRNRNRDPLTSEDVQAFTVNGDLLVLQAEGDA